MSDYERILQLILDTGTYMIQSGAETHRVEDSLYRMCGSYGFSNCNIWVIPSNIQATAIAPDGSCLTQIRHIRRSGIDFERLDDLNTLSRRVCREKPGPDTFAELLAETAGPPQPAWVSYLAGALAGGGFGVFFNCDPIDAVAAVCTSLLVVFLSRRIERREHNPLITNFIISFLAEVFIIISARYGLGHHIGYVAAGVVMLLISALGTTNGVRDLVKLDTLSGVLNISLSVTGAIGIAMGIALPLRLFMDQSTNEIMTLNPSLQFSLLACSVGCFGFSLWFRVKRRHILWCTLGAFLTWTAYSLCFYFVSSNFWAILTGSVVCGVYSQIMARVNKAPATIFQTVSVFPMIPGAALYYAMYGVVMGDYSFAGEKGIALVMSCFGIVLGFLLSQMLSQRIWPVSSNGDQKMECG